MKDITINLSHFCNKKWQGIPSVIQLIYELPIHYINIKIYDGYMGALMFWLELTFFRIYLSIGTPKLTTIIYCTQIVNRL